MEMALTPTPWSSILVVGSSGAGKSTLTNALGQQLRPEKLQQLYLPALPESIQTNAPNSPQPTFVRSSTRWYLLQDVPGTPINFFPEVHDYPNAALLVVSAFDPQLTYVRRFLRTQRPINLQHFVVFLNKAELETPDLIELIETELREEFNAAGLRGDEVAIFRGSALDTWLERAGSHQARSIEAVIDAFDVLPLPLLSLNRPIEPLSPTEFLLEKAPQNKERVLEAVWQVPSFRCHPGELHHEFLCLHCQTTLTPPLALRQFTMESQYGVPNYVHSVKVFLTDAPGVSLNPAVPGTLQCASCTASLGMREINEHDIASLNAPAIQQRILLL